MNALFIARMLLVASSVVPYLVVGQTSREPDRPSVRFSYPLSETSETTKIRGHKYDHGEVAELPEGTNVGSTNDHWWIGLTALPVTDSSLIFVGSVSKEHPFLSPDQTGVYTVYTFSIRRLFKNDLHFVSSSVEIDRRGGVVKFPSGKLQEYSEEGAGHLLKGKEYLIFAAARGAGEYQLITAYQLDGGKVLAVDGKRAGGTTLPFSDFDGVPMSSFINTLQRAIASY